MNEQRIVALLLASLAAALAGCGQFEVDTGIVNRKLIEKKTETRVLPAAGLRVEAYADPGEKIGTFRTDSEGKVSVDFEHFLKRGFEGRDLVIRFEVFGRDGRSVTSRHAIEAKGLREIFDSKAMRVGPCREPHRLKARAYYLRKGGILGEGESDTFRVAVENLGPGEAYRVTGTLTSDLPGLEEKNLPFGTLRKGQGKEWDIPIRVDPSWKKGYHKIRIEFRAHKKWSPRGIDTSLFIE